MAERTCPTCGDQNTRISATSLTGRRPSTTDLETLWSCKALVNALHAYAEEIDERSHPKQRFTDLFVSMARRLDDDLFVTARVCEVVIELGWRPGGAS